MSMLSASSSSSSSSGGTWESDSESSRALVNKFLGEPAGSTAWVEKLGLNLSGSSNKSFGVSRVSLAKVLEVCNIGGFKRLKGDLFNNLSSDLGRQRYKDLSSNMGLHCIYYCVTGLQSLRGSFGSTGKSVASSRNVLQKLEAILESAPKAGQSPQPLLNNIQALRSSEDMKNQPEIQQCLNKFPSDRSNLGLDQISKLLQELRLLVEDRLSRGRSLFNHDLLVLEFHNLYDSSQTLFIRAEKLGYPDAGIYIQPEKQFHLDKAQKSVLFKLQFGGNRFLTLKKAEEILENFELDYSLGRSCCWDYAVHMCEALLNESAELPGLYAAEKERLRSEARAIRGRCTFQSTIGLLSYLTRKN